MVEVCKLKKTRPILSQKKNNNIKSRIFKQKQNENKSISINMFIIIRRVISK